MRLIHDRSPARPPSFTDGQIAIDSDQPPNLESEERECANHVPNDFVPEIDAPFEIIVYLHFRVPRNV